MRTEKPSLLTRICLACRVFLVVVVDGQFASRVQTLFSDEQHREPSITPPGPAASPAKPMAAVPGDVAPDGALQLLGLLQREARFVDFIQEEVAAYADAEIGAAARVVHEGCRKVLRDNFTLRSVREEGEGSRVTLPAGFDAAANRVTGNVVGQPPFSGSVTHRGWRVVDTRLPKLASGHDLRILAPAEVEL